MQKHKELTNKLLVYLHANYKGRFWENRSGAIKDATGRFQRYGLVGSADIIGYTEQGRAVFIEVKITPDKLSKQQIAFKEVCESHNCLHIVVKDTINESYFNLLTTKLLNEERPNGNGI